MLLVGFDSAWTPTNSGALVGVLQNDDGTFQELGPPQPINYAEAEDVIQAWQAKYAPRATLVLLDQPTIVKNAGGQRPVENIVGSPVGLRYGGVQPASTSKTAMFSEKAPVWRFLAQFGGAADPLEPLANTRVFETYPVLAMIALGWTQPAPRPTGRLPKYNPERRRTFSNSDWQHVCSLTSLAFLERGLMEIVGWIEGAARKPLPGKGDQDGLDACLCLLVALHLVERRGCLMVGTGTPAKTTTQNSIVSLPRGPAVCGQTTRFAQAMIRRWRSSCGVICSGQTASSPCASYCTLPIPATSQCLINTTLDP